MIQQRAVFYPIGLIALAMFIPGMAIAPKAARAMPTFAQAYGLSCSACHTQVPLLNAYGRYVARTGYAALDRKVLAKALPIWLGEAANYDSTAGSGTGVPRYSFGNLALHGAGYLAPNLTFHAQQFITAGDQSGGIDTLWLTYNDLLNHDGHLFVGKILNPAPAPYSQDFQLDGAGASSTTVGEHAWGATYGNRWGTRFAYVRKALDLEAGYYLTSEDLKGFTDFGPGDKTFQWKIAYARPDVPVEAGLFGSIGSLSVSTGTDAYRSVAGFLQIDPGEHARPGLFVVYHRGQDDNPGIDAASGNLMPATSSHGASFELFEPILHNEATVAFRRDLNSDGFGTFGSGNAINVSFNIPHFTYAHGYLEANLGGNSALAGASGGPTWKGMLWLTLPIQAVAKRHAAAVAAEAPAVAAATTPPADRGTAVPSSSITAAAQSPAPQATVKALVSAIGDATRGKTLYAMNCAACHGATGHEGGIGPSLRGEKNKMDRAAVVAWIKKPLPPMPKLYPSPLNAKDVNDVAAFIETL